MAIDILPLSPIELKTVMGDTIGTSIVDQYFGLRYQVLVSVSLRSS